ncbi:MAG: hypothetical protein V4697_00780 [Patescibacteria group bacterium]
MLRYWFPLMTFLGACTGAMAAFAVDPGTVIVWGWSIDGQTNVPMAARGGVIAISVGGDYEGGHVVALKTNGSVVAWGRNDTGQATVPVAAQSGVAAIAAGGFHTLALKTNGSVVAWGYNGDGQTDVPVAAQGGVVAIAAGLDHSLALKNDGTVVGWGYDFYDQVTGPTGSTGVTAIAAGGDHSLIMQANGLVSEWGDNRDDPDEPLEVPYSARFTNMAMAAGYLHSAVLKSNGLVLVWGPSSHGERVVPLAAQSGVKAIAGGGDSDEGGHMLALKGDGTVVAWGFNGYGQTAAPAGLTGVTAVAAGGYNSAALVGFPVSLQTRWNGGDVVLIWPAYASAFCLQSTLVLTSNAAWGDVTNPPVLSEGQWFVTNNASESARFYRLKKL